MLNSQKMESRWLKVKTLKTRNRVGSIHKNIYWVHWSLYLSRKGLLNLNLIPSAKPEICDLTRPCISSLNMHLGIYDFCTLKWDNFLPICQLGKLNQMHVILSIFLNVERWPTWPCQPFSSLGSHNLKMVMVDLLIVQWSLRQSYIRFFMHFKIFSEVTVLYCNTGTSVSISLIMRAIVYSTKQV